MPYLINAFIFLASVSSLAPEFAELLGSEAVDYNSLLAVNYLGLIAAVLWNFMFWSMMIVAIAIRHGIDSSSIRLTNKSVYDPPGRITLVMPGVAFLVSSYGVYVHGYPITSMLIIVTFGLAVGLRSTLTKFIKE